MDPPSGGKEKEIQAAFFKIHGKVEVEANFYDEKMNFKKFINLLRTRTFALLLINEIPLFIPFGVFYTFLQDFLSYNVGPLVGGISMQQTMIVILVYVLGFILGSLFGGYIMDVLWKRKYEYVIYFTVLAICLGTVSNISIFIPKAIGSVYIYAAAFFPVAILVAMPVTITRTILTNVTLPETRGVAMALVSAAIDLGTGIGPVVFSAFLGGVNDDRYKAFILSTSLWTISVILVAISVCFLRKDINENSKTLIVIMRRKETVEETIKAIQNDEELGTPESNSVNSIETKQTNDNEIIVNI